MYTDYLYQWAKRAGLVTKRDEFGDVYGLDDEVRSSSCSLRLAHKLIKELFSSSIIPSKNHTAPRDRPKTNEGCDPALSRRT
jgi:hypothetical protein